MCQKCPQGMKRRIAELETENKHLDQIREGITDWIAAMAVKDDGAVFLAATDVAKTAPISYEDLRVLMTIAEVPFVGPVTKLRSELEKELEVVTLERDLLRKRIEEMAEEGMEVPLERCVVLCEEDIMNIKDCIARTRDSWEPHVDLWPLTLLHVVEEWEKNNAMEEP